MHSPNLTPFYQQELLEELGEKIEVLWATQFSRWTKPEPKEEISRVLSYLTRTLYPTLPQVHQKLHQAIHYYYQQESDIPDHPLLTVGSWVGGDMDGNPYVTPDVFSDALSRQHRAILELYAQDLRTTLDKLSHALHRIGINPTLRDSILRDLDEMRQAKEDTRNYVELLEREPYRLKLTLMALKLERTISQNMFLTMDSRMAMPFVYASAGELLEELNLVCQSLAEKGYKRSIHTRLDKLRQTIRIFGFHFASIDLREETGHINLTAKAVLEASAVCNPANLTDALTDEILSKKVLNTQHWEESRANLPYGDQERTIIRRMLGMLDLANKARRFIDPQACHNLVLTMTSAPEDILCALLLMKTQGLFYPVYNACGDGETFASHMAFYDLQGKILNLPVWKLWGLDPQKAPKSSYTIGIADLDTVKHKTEVALSRGYDVLKVKLGSPNDVSLFETIRRMAPHPQITMRWASSRSNASCARSTSEITSPIPKIRVAIRSG